MRRSGTRSDPMTACNCKQRCLQLQAVTEKHSDIGSFIREQREAAALSLRKLADKAGISNPYLSQIERGLRKPSAEILKSLADGLQISAETLYTQAGLLDEDRPSVVKVAIEADPKLTDEQKLQLLSLYRELTESEDEEGTAS